MGQHGDNASNTVYDVQQLLLNMNVLIVIDKGIYRVGQKTGHYV